MSARSLGSEATTASGARRRSSAAAANAFVPQWLSSSFASVRDTIAAWQAEAAEPPGVAVPAHGAPGAGPERLIYPPADGARRGTGGGGGALQAEAQAQAQFEADLRMALELDARERGEAVPVPVGNNAEREDTLEDRVEAFQFWACSMLVLTILNVAMLAAFRNSVHECVPLVGDYLLLFVALCVANVLWRGLAAMEANDTPQRLARLDTLETVVDLLGFGVLVVGHVALIGSWDSCEAAGAVELLYLATAMLVLNYMLAIGVVVAVALLALLCACSPCLAYLIYSFSKPNWKRASRKAINRLPVEVFGRGTAAAADAASASGGGANAPNCPICLEDLQAGDVLRRLPCEHRLHKECVDPWLMLNGTCPSCRERVDGIILEQEAAQV